MATVGISTPLYPNLEYMIDDNRLIINYDPKRNTGLEYNKNYQSKIFPAYNIIKDYIMFKDHEKVPGIMSIVIINFSHFMRVSGLLVKIILAQLFATT